MVYLFTRSKYITSLHFFYADNYIYRIEENGFTCYWKHEPHSDICHCKTPISSLNIPPEKDWLLINITDYREEDLFNLFDSLIMNKILNSI